MVEGDTDNMILCSHTEVLSPYLRATLHNSIIAACYSVRATEGVARDAAHAVCHAVEAWLADKSLVTSNDIRRIAARTLSKHHPDAGYLYQHHHTML